MADKKLFISNSLKQKMQEDEYHRRVELNAWHYYVRKLDPCGRPWQTARDLNL